MANGNQQRCCILGVCCPPGSAEQRAAMRAWLLEKVLPVAGVGGLDVEVDRWLDELPWGQAK